jgi:hypothetical protein
VFVLREVFETPYDEIAEAVGKTPAAVLLDVLAPDVVVVSEGGSEVLTARPFEGAGRVVTLRVRCPVSMKLRHGRRAELLCLRCVRCPVGR